ncbi:MAG: HutD family protein [Rhodoferax sp.]|nr:HutD family protein [Rhodoferax sp.]
MKHQIVIAADVAPQPWRNGGGQTRELLAWPDANDWQLRISRADIEADGPFSAFPGVQRWFAVLRGVGVALRFADGERLLRQSDAPLQFDGAAAPGCRLLDGATQDLNLMARGGTGCMQQVLAHQPWQDRFALRALYTAVPGRWNTARASADLPAHTLLWAQEADTEAWTFQPASHVAEAKAWWLGFRPGGA